MKGAHAKGARAKDVGSAAPIHVDAKRTASVVGDGAAVSDVGRSGGSSVTTRTPKSATPKSATPKSATPKSVTLTSATTTSTTPASTTAATVTPVGDASNQTVTTAAAQPVQPLVVQVVIPRDGWQQVVAGLISTVTSDAQSVVSGLPVPGEFGQLVMGALWTTRRAFFNQAPVIAPVQTSTQSTGPITGRVDAVDPEGDPIVYRLTSGPRSGGVQINPDGTYTYTPGSDFNGFDTFTIAAQDVGLQVNLLDPFRADGTRAIVRVNQGGITFAFNFTTGSQYWSTAARTALQSAANSLAQHFLVTSQVTLTYNVSGEDSTSTDVLASAGSGLIGSGVGFHRTVVQNKLISGVDANGTAADGQINWNFGYSWGLGASVAPDQYDFTSTAMHELMHSFGFLSYVNQPGANTGQGWTTFDSFVVTANGTNAIGSGFRWNSAYDPNLTGGNGGLYFGGPDAVAAYGSPVPLYTPNPWVSGSSMSHLDDATFTGSMQQLMNATTGTGPGVRVLSPAELGILTDLGYTVIPQTSTYAMAMVGCIFVRRFRMKPQEHSARMSR